MHTSLSRDIKSYSDKSRHDLLDILALALVELKEFDSIMIENGHANAAMAKDYMSLMDKCKNMEEEIKKLADEIRKWVWDNCYDKKKGKLLQYPGSKHQDASNFLFVALKFLNKDDPITRKILENTEKELVEKKIFVRRYKLNDKFKGKEGAFILCSFWRISAWAIMGETEKADKLFHEVEKKFSKNGLMSEEINPKNCDLLGNYPQAFSHLGHIMSSHNIHKYKRLLKEEKSKVKK